MVSPPMLAALLRATICNSFATASSERSNMIFDVTEVLVRPRFLQLLTSLGSSTRTFSPPSVSFRVEQADSRKAVPRMMIGIFFMSGFLCRHQVQDAWKILSIELSSVLLNSSSLCCALKPSDSATTFSVLACSMQGR